MTSTVDSLVEVYIVSGTKRAGHRRGRSQLTLGNPGTILEQAASPYGLSNEISDMSLRPAFTPSPNVDLVVDRAVQTWSMTHRRDTR